MTWCFNVNTVISSIKTLAINLKDMYESSCKPICCSGTISWTIESLIMGKLATIESQRWLSDLEIWCIIFLFPATSAEASLPQVSNASTHSRVHVQVGLKAINDANVLQTHISQILKTHLQILPIYTQLLDIFNDVILASRCQATLMVKVDCSLHTIYTKLHIIQAHLISQCSCSQLVSHVMSF